MPAICVTASEMLVLTSWPPSSQAHMFSAMSVIRTPLIDNTPTISSKKKMFTSEYGVSGSGGGPVIRFLRRCTASQQCCGPDHQKLFHVSSPLRLVPTIAKKAGRNVAPKPCGRNLPRCRCETERTPTRYVILNLL